MSQQPLQSLNLKKQPKKYGRRQPLKPTTTGVMHFNSIRESTIFLVNLDLFVSIHWITKFKRFLIDMKSKLWDIDKFLVNVQHQGGGGGGWAKITRLSCVTVRCNTLRHSSLAKLRYDMLCYIARRYTASSAIICFAM